MWRSVGGLKARHYRSPLYETFCAAVGWECKARKVKKIEGEIHVDIIWYRAKRIGDADNRIKPILDALQGFAYKDDKQVIKVCIEKIDGHEKKGTVQVKIEQHVGG